MRGDNGHPGVEGRPQQKGAVELLGRLVKGRDRALGSDVAEQGESAGGKFVIKRPA
jgi:hypothetical protein